MAAVSVFDPSGNLRQVDESRLQAALQAGGHRAVQMRDPMGNARYVREEDVERAQKAGGTLVGQPALAARQPMFSGAMERMFGKGAAVTPGGYMAAAGNAASNMAQHAAQAVSGPYHAFADDPRTPEEAAQKGSAGALGQLGLGVARMTVNPTLDALREAWKQRKAGNTGQVFSGEPYDAQGNYKPNVLSSLSDAVPIAGPWARNIDNEAHQKGILPAVAGAVTDVAAPEALGKLAAAPRFLKRAGQNAIAPEAALGKMLPDDTVTAAQRYADAKAQGVNLDLAQATNGKAAAAAKAGTEHSLLGRGKYEENAEANKTALQRHADAVLAKASPTPLSREEFGNKAKDLLLNHQRMLNDRAGAVYDDLSSRVGANQPDVSGVRATAQKIIDDHKNLYDISPELLKGGTGHAWGLTKSLASDIAPDGATKGQYSWSDLHKLRSALLDSTRSPDIVGTQQEGWLKQLTGAVDKSMTDAGSGLSGADLDKFRDANQVYSRMKDRYDSPQSKLYHIARAPDGLSAANMMTDLSPKMARNVGHAATDLAETGYDSRDFIPQLQRQTMDRMLRPEGNDVADLKNLPSRFNRAQKEKLNGVLSPDQMGDMERLARTSKVVYGDSNPSGSGKVLTAIGDARGIATGLGEAAGAVALGHPAGALLGAVPVATSLGQKAIAEAMTNPAKVESAMAAKDPIEPATPTPVKDLASAAASENESRTESEPAEAAAPPATETQEQTLHPEGRPALPTGYTQTAPIVTPATHVFSVSSWKAAHPDEDEAEAKEAAAAAGYEVHE